MIACCQDKGMNSTTAPAITKADLTERKRGKGGMESGACATLARATGGAPSGAGAAALVRCVDEARMLGEVLDQGLAKLAAATAPHGCDTVCGVTS